MDQEITSQKIDNILPPRKSATIDALLKVNKVDHPIAKKYLEEFEIYQKKMVDHLSKFPKKEEAILPELKRINPDNLYEVFKDAFKFFNGKEFNETANDGEGRILAKTLIYYFLQRKAFYQSPLLNKTINVPSLQKGFMIIGGVGTGKTSIVRTFHLMFKFAANNPLGVEDIEGTIQFLGRYKLGFGFHSTNDVVDEYEGCIDDLAKKSFQNKYNFNNRYFDDLMSEDVANNYGKKEVFKKMLEKRYFNQVNTMVSLNYHGANTEETFEALSERYGTRVDDRNFEMYNVIELQGKSLRK